MNLNFFSILTIPSSHVLNNHPCSLPLRTPSAYQASRCEVLTQITETAETLQWLAHVEVLNQYIQIMFDGYYSGNDISIRIINNTENGFTIVQPLLHHIILLTGNTTYDLLLKWRMGSVCACLRFVLRNSRFRKVKRMKGWKMLYLFLRILYSSLRIYSAQCDCHYHDDTLRAV